MKKNLRILFSLDRRVFATLGMLLLLALPMSKMHADETTSDDFSNLIEKIWADKGWNPTASTISSYMNDMDSNGKFGGVNYSTYTNNNKTYTNTGIVSHLDRLEAMAAAYVNSANTYYQSADLFNKISLGLQYWYNTNPNFENWWYNQIAEPQRLGLIFVFLTKGKEQLDTTLANNTITRWKTDGGDPGKWTGANQTDIALHRIYLSCYTKDESLLKESIGYIFNPLCYTTEEGFQVDNSFFQHGYQIYIGGYGDAILAGVLPVATYVEGTKFQLTDAQRELLCKFVRETFTDVIRGQTSNFDCLGRGISRSGALRKAGSWVNYINYTKELDPEHADMYNADIKRIQGTSKPNYNAPTKHTHFFRADYTLHMRPTYNFSVRTVSTRTERCEYGNGENEKGYFIADGCTDIARTGDEYYNIMPLWDWNFIPGTTVPKMSTLPKETGAWGLAGTSSFTGGVSDSLYGATTYNYTETGKTSTVSMSYRARKSWFFFDDEVVCLGAGIVSSSNILTTLDQCWGQSYFYLGKSDGSYKLLAGEVEDTTLVDTCKFILHNSIGYSFPNGGRVEVSNKTRTGSWSLINTGGSTTTQSGKVFTLQIDHQYPRNTTSAYLPKTKYAYIVYPETSISKLKSSLEKGDIDIAWNSDTAQVVHHKGLGIYQMIFYRAAEYKDDSIHVKVSNPCALLFKNLNSPNLTFHIADPGQSKRNITVSVKTEALQYMRTATVGFSGLETQYAGETQVVTLTPESEIVGINSTTAESDKLQSVTCSPRSIRPGQTFEVQAEGANEGRVEIYSMDGIKQAESNLEGGVSTFSLPQSGVYVIRVISKGNTASTKILVR